MGSADHSALVAKFELGDIIDEQQEIEDTYLSMRFAQKVRHATISCYKHCGGKPKFPFQVEPKTLLGKNEVCFSDCLNMQFEKGPFLKDLGTVPEGSIAKKFIWTHGI